MQTKCPACYKKIGPFDQYCPCGWSMAETGALPVNECGWPDCTSPAITSVEASTRRVSLCHVHYLEYHKRQAISGAKARGLNTPEECREWLRQNKLRPMKFPN